MEFQRPSEKRFYNSMTKERRPPTYALHKEGSRPLVGPSLSAANCEGHGHQAVPNFFGRKTPGQPTETGALSSTFASRRNFAASSGGVGLM
jgi:hypothetical protein